MNKGECEEIKLRLGKTDISRIHEDGRKRRWLLLIPTVAAVGIFIAFASIDKVNDREDEVIATFGLVMGTAETGRRFKPSLGLQDVHITDARLAEEKTAGAERGNGNLPVQAYDTQEKQGFCSFLCALDVLEAPITDSEKTVMIGRNSPLAEILLGG